MSEQDEPHSPSELPPALIEATPPTGPTELVEHRLGGRTGLRVEQVPGGIHHVRVGSQQLPSANANAVPAQHLLDMMVEYAEEEANVVLERIRKVLLERLGAG